MEFKDRLRQLRQELSLNQSEFGQKFNVIKQTVSSWEQGNSKPDLDLLVSMANFFKVSTDYLLANDRSTTKPQTVPMDGVLLVNRIKALREEKGLTQSQLGKLLNVQDAAISKYESGKIPLTRAC